MDTSLSLYGRPVAWHVEPYMMPPIVCASSERARLAAIAAMPLGPVKLVTTYRQTTPLGPVHRKVTAQY